MTARHALGESLGPIEGGTGSKRCDSLAQLPWQANTYPHPLYSSQTQLRPSRSIHVYRHGVHARQLAWAQPVPTALNAAQWATQDNAAHKRKTLLARHAAPPAEPQMSLPT